MNAKRIFGLFKDSFAGWNLHEVSLHAAALAYYSILSLAPLLVISVAIGALAFNQAAVEAKIVAEVERTIGKEASTVIHDLVRDNSGVISSSVATGIGALVSLFVASTVFWQLQGSLNAMWGIEPQAEAIHQSLVGVIKARLVAALVVLAISFLFLLSLFINALWVAVPEKYLQGLLPNFESLALLFRFVASPVVLMLIFAVIFKMLPSARIRWRDVWPGATVTALLFWLGSYLIGLYLAHSGVASVYGAAGSLIAFLVWAYASASILLFGAKFTKTYADRYGAPIVPTRDAMFRGVAGR